MNAIVVWEKASFDSDGQQQRATSYACLGDQGTPTAALGLALHLLRTLERDIIGCSCEND